MTELAHITKLGDPLIQDNFELNGMSTLDPVLIAGATLEEGIDKTTLCVKYLLMEGRTVSDLFSPKKARVYNTEMAELKILKRDGTPAMVYDLCDLTYTGYKLSVDATDNDALYIELRYSVGIVS